MRILHLGKYYPPAPGGMERFLADLVAAQRAAGDDVAVLVHDDGRSDRAGDPPWLMRAPVWMKLVFAPLSPLYPFWLARAIRRHRPEVLHIHMPNLSALWALAVPAARRIPWVVQWQSDVVASRFRLGLRLAYPWYRIFEASLVERADCIVVASPQYLASSEPLQRWQDKCHVVPLGIDPARLPPVAEHAGDDLWRGRGLRVLSVGRLTYYKGFDTLVRAAAGASALDVVVVGGGEERARLERLREASADPQAIRFVGEVDDATLRRYLASCEVFCLPSVERTEAFGIVLLEAMRYGKPIVASRIEGSGVAMVARDGQNAVLVPAGDPQALRAALEGLAQSPARRHVLGRLGLERYEREFQIGAVAARIRSLYAMTIRAAHALAPSPGEAHDTLDAETPEPAARANGKLLVVIPALNEAARIGKVIAGARAHAGADVVVVDDGSTDDTAAVATLHGATVLRAPLWQGAWGAIQTGIRYAMRKGYSGVVTMDADGQHEPEYLPQMLEAARHADVVIAACPSRGSRLRHIAWTYFRFLTGLSFDDLTSGFRYYNARSCSLLATEEATLLDYQDIGVLLLLRRANLRIAEIAVAMNPRREGVSRVFSSWWTIARYMAETSLLALARWNPPRRRAKRA